MYSVLFPALLSFMLSSALFWLDILHVAVLPFVLSYFYNLPSVVIWGLMLYKMILPEGAWSREHNAVRGKSKKISHHQLFFH